MTKRLDISELPRDTEQAMGVFRVALCKTFNYCRMYPRKMSLLKETVKYVFTRIKAWEEESAAELEAGVKAKLAKKALGLGLELDRTLSVPELEKLVAAEVAKQEEDTTKLKSLEGATK